MLRFLIILASCAAFYLLLFHLFRTFTDVNALRTEYPHFVYDPETETAQMEILKKRPPGWVSLKEVNPLAWNAIVLSEDWAFWQHNGFDWDQLWDAMQTNLRAGHIVRGGSTITQQVVKNVYLTHEKTFLRKAQEALLTSRVERHVGKRRILEIYLNVAEFGKGLFGIGPAAQFYFHKPASALGAKEGAFLAMLLPSPKKYAVSYRKKALTPFAQAAVKNILGKLLATKRISQEEYDRELATPLSFETAGAAVMQPGTKEEEAPVDEDEGSDDSAEEAPAQAAPLAAT
jgi:monofunctional glycosyltransferase